MRRKASLLIALGAAIVELIILAAAGNQWVIDHLVRNATSRELPRTRELKQTLTSFPWRFTSEHGDRMLWLGQLVAAVGLVVLVFLLVFAFAAALHPPRRFVAVLLGTWGLVLGLTVLATIGRLMLAYSDLFPTGTDPEGLRRYWYSVFRGPTPEAVLFGAVGGLLVGLVAAIIAALTNRAVAEPEDEMEGALTEQQPDTALWPAPTGPAPTGYELRTTPAPREAAAQREAPTPREAPTSRDAPTPRDAPSHRESPSQVDTSWRATGTPSWAELSSARSGDGSWGSRPEPTTEMPPPAPVARSPFPGDNVEPPAR